MLLTSIFQFDSGYGVHKVIIQEIKGEDNMSELDALLCRKNKLLMNGKNSEGQGVLRKIERKIRKAQEKQK